MTERPRGLDNVLAVVATASRIIDKGDLRLEGGKSVLRPIRLGRFRKLLADQETLSENRDVLPLLRVTNVPETPHQDTKVREKL